MAVSLVVAGARADVTALPPRRRRADRAAPASCRRSFASAVDLGVARVAADDRGNRPGDWPPLSRIARLELPDRSRWVLMTVWLLSVSSGLALASALGATPCVDAPTPAGRRLPGCAIAWAPTCAVVPPPSDAGTSTPVDAWTDGLIPSFRTLRDALAPAGAGRYRVLPVPAAQHEPGSRRAGHGVRHPSLAARRGPGAMRPHVFLFVVDSLRRDYLSAYNRDVTFTPVARRVRGREHWCSSAPSPATAPPGSRCRRSGWAAWCRTSSIRTPFGPFNALQPPAAARAVLRRGCRGTTWWTRSCRAKDRGRRSAPTAR